MQISQTIDPYLTDTIKIIVVLTNTNLPQYVVIISN